MKEQPKAGMAKYEFNELESNLNMQFKAEMVKNELNPLESNLNEQLRVEMDLTSSSSKRSSPIGTSSSSQ